MRKKITLIEVIIVIVVIVAVVKGYQFWNKPEEVPVIERPSVVPSSFPADKAFSEGIHFLKICNYDKAIDCFSFATNGPQAVEAWVYMGYALLKQHEYSKSIDCIDKALEINPDMCLALNLKGEILWLQGKTEEGIKYNDRVLDINPLFPDAVADRGIILYRLNKKENTEECLKYMEKAIELAPDYAGLKWMKGNFLHYHLHRQKEAIEYYDKALKLDSYCFKIWYDKGVALYQLNKNTEEIIRFYDEALKAAPDNYGIWYAKGLFYKYYMKNLTKERECFNKALEFNPGFYQVQQELKTTPYDDPGVIIYLPSPVFSENIQIDMEVDIWTAITNRDTERVKKIIKENPNVVNLKGDDGLTPLYYAVRVKNKEIIDLLIKNGADVNARNNIKETPLYYAIFYGNDTEIMELLIENGADVNVKSLGGYTPLHHITTRDAALLLMENGAEINNVRDKDGRTPLHLAALNGNKEVVLILIENGAFVNDKNSYNITPLHFAAAVNKEITEILIENGADVNVRNNKKETPLDIAKKCDQEEIVELLKKYGAKEGKVLPVTPVPHLASKEKDDNMKLEEYYYIRGNEALVDGRYEDALENFNKSLEQKPDNTASLVGKGTTLYFLGEYDVALSYFDDILNRPSAKDCYKYAYNGKGCVFLKLEEYDAALSCFDNILNIPSAKDYYKHAYNGKGCVFLKLEEYERAIEYFDKAISLDPDFKKPQEHKEEALKALEN